MSPINAATPGRQPLEKFAQLAVWLTPALWAVNYVIARKAPDVVGPYTLAFGRWFLAGLVLVFLARQELWQQRKHVAHAWKQYLVLGFCGMLVCGAWVYLGARTTVAMNIALIYSASPVLIAIGAVLWLGEKFRWSQVAGVVLAMTGVVHVIVKGQWAALGQVQWVPGDLWIVSAMVAWAAYALLQKWWPSPLSATARLAAIALGGVLVLLPCAVWETFQPATHPLSLQAVQLMALAALLPGLCAYWLYGWAQKVLGASQVAMTLYLGPLYAAVAAYLILHEPMGWHHLVGAALILPGVYGVSRR